MTTQKYDPDRCEGRYHCSMLSVMIPGVLEPERCPNKPTHIAFEPGTNKNGGSMSLCDSCLEKMRKQMGILFAETEKIEDPEWKAEWEKFREDPNHSEQNYAIFKGGWDAKKDRENFTLSRGGLHLLKDVVYCIEILQELLRVRGHVTGCGDTPLMEIKKIIAMVEGTK